MFTGFRCPFVHFAHYYPLFRVYLSSHTLGLLIMRFGGAGSDEQLISVITRYRIAL